MTARRRPNYLTWSSLALVAAGAAVGAAAREGVKLTVPDAAGIPIAIALVNVLGACALGYLYESVTRLGPGSTMAARAKLLLGTGFCGGFTTYSALATDSADLYSQGHPAAASLYALGTVFLGACATFAGIVLATRVNARVSARAGSPAERIR